MKIDIAEERRPRLAYILRAHAASMGRNGTAAPSWLTAMADELMPGHDPARPAEMTREERERVLTRERKRRQRARLRGEDVPHRKPGPQPRNRDLIDIG